MSNSEHRPQSPLFGEISFEDGEYEDNPSFEAALSQAEALVLKTSTPENQELVEQEKAAPHQSPVASDHSNEEKVATPEQSAPKQTPEEKLVQSDQPAPQEHTAVELQEEHHSDEESDIIPESDCEGREDDDDDGPAEKQLETSKNAEPCEESEDQYFKMPEKKKQVRQRLIGSQLFSPRKQAEDPTPAALKIKDLEDQIHGKEMQLKSKVNSMECSFKKEREKKKEKLNKARIKYNSDQVKYTESVKRAKMDLERWVAAEESQQDLTIDAAALEVEEKELTEKMKKFEDKKMNFKNISKAADENVLTMAQEKENSKQMVKGCKERYEKIRAELKEVKIDFFIHY
jgi:hypothetical protein